MAELQTYLTGIADAIRSKKGTTAPINAKDFASEIRNIAGSGGSGGGTVEVPPVTNLAVENGVLTFTKPDVTELINNGATISYLVTINETTIEIEDSGFNISEYLVTGENTIKVIVKAIIPVEGASKDSNIEYEKVSVETITTLSVTLPQAVNGITAALIDNNIYLFGGYDGSSGTDSIQKFDTTSETITTLSTTLAARSSGLGAGIINKTIYLIGVSTDSIQKFDTTSETITTLSKQFPVTNFRNMTISVVGNNIYTLGGYSYNKGINQIYKFNTTSETITTLSVTLPEKIYSMAYASVKNNTYIFGGYKSDGDGNKGNQDKIYKFDGVNETLTTLPITLPLAQNGLCAATIDNNIYIFSSSTNAIYKFDSVSETITVLDITLPQIISGMRAVSINKNIYLFGGYSDGSRLNLIQKFSC